MNRKEFMEIIKFIKQHCEPITFVANKVNRMQRSQKEAHVLDKLVRKGKLELHFNSDSYSIHQKSTANELIMWDMGIVIAKWSYCQMLCMKKIRQHIFSHLSYR